MIKSIVFDVDGTLYDETHAKVKAELLTANYISEISNIDTDIVYNTFRSAKSNIIKTNTGTPNANNRLLWYEETLKRLNITNMSIVNLSNLYWDVIVKNIEPFFDLIFVLPELSKNYKLYILTDELLDIQNRKIDSLGLRSYFPVIFSSQQIGENKPSKKLFKYVIDSIGFNPNEILYIGDNPKADIKGGKQVGMHTAWLKRGKFFFYNSREDEQAEIVFTNYIQLVKEINQIFHR